jgi:hypothetical protein
MRLKTYLKYSGLWAGVICNPYQWQFKIRFGSEGILEDEPLFGISIYLGPVWIRLVIDNGEY